VKRFEDDSLTDLHPISVKNYEMGIVLPLPAEDTKKAATEFATWTRPPRKYDRDGDKPWVRDEWYDKGAWHAERLYLQMQKQFGALLEQGPEAINAEVLRYAM
jgi:hypothetical protein